MRWSRKSWAAIVCCGLAVLIAPPASAEILFEFAGWGHSAEDGPVDLPARAQVLQVISGDRFAAQGQFALLVELQLDGQQAADQGVVRVRPRLLRADGTTVKLPMMRADVAGGLGRATRLMDFSLQEGDIIRWKARLRGMPQLEEDATCLLLFAVASRDIWEEAE